MNVIDVVTLVVIFLALVTVYIIWKYISKRVEKCGSEPLCYLTGIPNSMDYIKDQIEEKINNALNTVNPF
jgi:hypothetical protein